MHRNKTKIFLCLAVAFLALAPGFFAAEAAPETIRVGAYDNPPKIYVDEKGNAHGLFADVMNYIAKQEGWNVQYVKGTWDECMKSLENGEIDIMVDVAVSEERKKIYDFNNETVLNNWGQIYARKDLNIGSILDLDGKNMAIMKGGIHYTGLMGIKALADSFDLKINYIDVQVYGDVFKLLDEGKADVGAVNRIFGVTEVDKYKNIKPTNIVFNPNELRFAFTKGNPKNEHLIQKIDSDLRAIKDNPDSAYYKILRKHLKGAVERIAIMPFWAKASLWVALAILLVVLTLVFLQRKYQEVLRKAIDRKTKELLDSEIKYKNLFESSAHAIIIMDSDGLIDCNQAALKIFDIPTVGELVKKNLADLSPLTQANGENSQASFAEKMEAAFKEGSLNFEWLHARPDGSVFDADVILTKAMVEGKKVVQAVVRDISEQKKAEKKIKELNELRNKFIRIVSHQLRTPMNAIRWNLETIIKGDMGELTDAQREFLHSTYEAEIDVINRLGGLLTVIDIEEGRVALTKEAISMESLCGSVAGVWKKKFEIKGVEAKCLVPPQPLPPVPVDAGKMRDVFDYLFSNAFDYTPENGKVTAKLSKKGGFARFELTDTGIGIPEAEQSRIFAKFYRATNASTMVTDRSGISLAICKYYIEQHGGKIGFESKEGEGSTFWFEIPIIPYSVE